MGPSGEPLTPTSTYSDLAAASDEVLMEHLRTGHHDALAVLFDRYHRLVLRIALRILRDSGEAEDLMQTVFLEIFNSAAHFDPKRGTTKVWLLQYAYHRSFNRRQYLSLRGLYESQMESETNRDMRTESNKDCLNGFESAQLVREALGRLGKVQRRILELACYEGFTMREIARETGDSFDSVRHHYYRGLDKLRSILLEKPGARIEEISSEVEGLPDVQS